jgi:DNA-binding beta-propeller fold protein YncE
VIPCSTSTGVAANPRTNITYVTNKQDNTVSVHRS